MNNLNSKKIENIINVFYKIDIETKLKGADWYIIAHNFAVNLSQKYEINLETICALISVLSPTNNWEQNKKDAENLIRGFLNKNIHNYKFSTYGQNVIKGIKALNEKQKIDECLSYEKAAKTYCFANNIFQPKTKTFVTIDRHMMSMFFGIKTKKCLTKNQYKIIENHFVAAAEKLNLLPHVFQSILWFAYVKKVISISDFSH